MKPDNGANSSATIMSILPKISVDGVAKVGLTQARGLGANVLSIINERTKFPSLTAGLDLAYVSKSEILGRLRYDRYIENVSPNNCKFILAHNIPSAIVAYRLYQKYKIPYTVYMHDATFSKVPGTIPKFAPDEVSNSLSTSKAVLTNSNKTAIELWELYSVKGSPVYPGCSPASDINEKRDDYVLFVHSIAKNKNFDMVFQLMKRNEHLKLVIAGGKRYTWQAVYFMFKLRFGNRVQFIFNPGEERLTFLLRHARLVIHPGVENFGLSPLEAAAQGTPSVVTRGSGIVEVLEEGAETLAFDEGDLDSFSRIVNSHPDYSQLRDIGRNAWKRAKQFSWNDHIRSIGKLILA